MKTKKDYIIKKVGSGYVVVTVGEASREFNGMIRLNEAGAFVWNQLEKGTTKKALIKLMLERYEDLDEETAKADLNELLEKIEFSLEEE